MTYSQQQIYSIIESTANQEGVSPTLALATAQQESNFNANAVGDNGSSFGLYQLHQVGLLGSLTPTQAFNPVTNATVALANMAGVQKAYPWVTDPGQIAALAQKPAKPAGYAAAVDKNYANIQSKGLPSANAQTPLSFSTSAAGSGFNPLNPFSYGNIWGYVERGLVMLLGSGIILIGIYMLFSGKSSSDTIQVIPNQIKGVASNRQSKSKSNVTGAAEDVAETAVA